MNLIYMAFIFTLLMAGACNRKGEPQRQKVDNPGQYKEELMEANKILNQNEREAIQNYIKRKKWEMDSTGTGLRYMIYEKGSGEQAKKGKIAVMNYEVQLLTGEIVYSSEESGKKEFEIGKGGVESGLEEGILLMQVGDKAKFIMPSHLAHGLVGDDKKIPSRATLVYDVQLLDLK